MRSAKIWGIAGIAIVCLMIPHLGLWIVGRISAHVFSWVAVVVVALIHLYFGLLEATQWNRPAGLQIHGLTQEVADRTKPVGQNMGLYNALFALLLMGSFFLGRLDTFHAQAAILSLIVLAGVIGTLTIGSKKIVIVQSLPAALALAAVMLGQPGMITEEQAVKDIIGYERQLLEKKTEVRKDAKISTVLRGQHPKSVGFLVADFAVHEKLEPKYRHGVFKTPNARFRAVIRFSNARNLTDEKRGGHGMSIKLFDVKGDKLLPDAPEQDTQDFVLFDNASFFVRDAFDYVDFESAEFKATREDAEVNEPYLALLFPNPPSLFKLTRRIQRKPAANPLRSNYWSVVPYRLGPHAVKFKAWPKEAAVAEISNPSSSSINDELVKSLEGSPGKVFRFTFGAQLQADPDLMPIEDATVEWNEAQSPFVELATITVDTPASKDRFGDHLSLNVPQPTDADPKKQVQAERMSFSPWHGLIEHEPLGGINRVRRMVYEEMSKYRNDRNAAKESKPEPAKDKPAR